MKSFLTVSECFYSIQGEGQTAGHPAVFLRLAGCNLLCKGSGWRCDTIEVWRKGTRTQFENVLSEEYVSHLTAGAHLVITGGEPMLVQAELIQFINWFHSTYDFLPIVEIETNGTVLPRNDLVELVNYWNVSFKLSTCGEPYKKRINIAALDAFDKLPNAVFKIVISCEMDVLELINDFDKYVRSGKMILMPAGENQEQLTRTRYIAAIACKTLYLQYCDKTIL
jgi:organic radical activating enzyme